MLLNVFMVTDACQVLEIYVPSCQVLEIYVPCIIESKTRLLTPKDKAICFGILIPLDLNIFRVNFQKNLFLF